MINKTPLVSINIPTWNSAKTLSNALESINKQTYKKIEVIIADGGSKDDTLKIAKKYKAKITFGKELGRARFEAIKKSSGKYIFAFDSDMFMDKRLVERCVKEMESNKYDALIVYEKSIVRKGNFISGLLALDKEIVVDSQDANPLFGAAIPRFFKREMLMKLKWPKKLSILDDAVLFSKNLDKLKSVGFIKKPGISHYEVTDFKSFYKKFIRYGRLYMSTLKTSPETTLAHSIPRRSYLSKRVIKDPSVLIKLGTLYSIKASAVISGIIIEVISKRSKK